MTTGHDGHDEAFVSFRLNARHAAHGGGGSREFHFDGCGGPLAVTTLPWPRMAGPLLAAASRLITTQSTWTAQSVDVIIITKSVARLVLVRCCKTAPAASSGRVERERHAADA